MTEKKKKTKIMVFGTFDGLHEGHLDFFKQARELYTCSPSQHTHAWRPGQPPPQAACVCCEGHDTEPFLIVSVARDKNVLRIKGRSPRLSEDARVALVRELGLPDPRGRGDSPHPQPLSLLRRGEQKPVALVDKVVLGSEGEGAKDHIPHILKERPDIIALGYDQEAYVKDLEEDLKKAGLVVKVIRLKPFREDVFKNGLIHG